MQNHLFYFLIPLIGVGACLIGLGALLTPEMASKYFGIKATGKETHYVRACGARDIFIGLVLLFLFWRDDRQALAFVCFFTAIVSSCDFLLTRIYGSKLASYLHLLATFFIIGYGIWLLQYQNVAT